MLVSGGETGKHTLLELGNASESKKRYGLQVEEEEEANVDVEQVEGEAEGQGDEGVKIKNEDQHLLREEQVVVNVEDEGNYVVGNGNEQEEGAGEVELLKSEASSSVCQTIPLVNSSCESTLFACDA